MRTQRHRRGQMLVDYTAMFALFVVVTLLLGYYAKGALGNKYKEAADGISEGQFDPKRGTFHITSGSDVTRNEVTQTTGVSVSTIENEKSTHDVTQSNKAPTASDKLFDAKW